jgi:hypothetical protein
MLNRDWFIKSDQVSETAGTKWSQWPKTRSLIEQRHLEVGGIFHRPPAIPIDLERALLVSEIARYERITNAGQAGRQSGCWIPNA